MTFRSKIFGEDRKMQLTSDELKAAADGQAVEVTIDGKEF